MQLQVDHESDAPTNVPLMEGSFLMYTWNLYDGSEKKNLYYTRISQDRL
jgi:hypothetical protein